MPLKTPLREHQAEAKNAVITEFQTAVRTTVIMPCGTGKTLVGASLAADCQEVILLFPSIALIRQTLDVWRYEGLTQGKELLVVCSDKQAADRDDVIVTEQELGCHITTRPEEVIGFFRTARNSLVFTTYHSAALIEEALPVGYRFDFAIFDEAHRTAQDQEGQFTVALDDTAIPCARRLFMTATPRFGVGPGDGVASGYAMNNEQMYGRICHQLSHQEAVRRGLICETRTIVGATSHNELRALVSGTGYGGTITPAMVNVGQAISIRRAMDTFGIKKVVTFHKTIAEAEQFSTQATVQNELAVPCFFIHGQMSGSERQRILNEFAAADEAVISNARCLTEGIDVPSIDMVAFMSRKRSVVDVVQAVGRSARNAENKEAGYVLIPLVAEQDDGQIDKRQFQEVFNILTSLIEEASVISFNTGTRDANYEWRKTVSEKLGDYTVLTEHVDAQALRQQIEVYCESRSAHTFDHWYPILLAQQREHGRPLSGKLRSPEQVEWERYIRAVHREGRLGKEKEHLLSAIGFKWTRNQSDRWDDQFEALKFQITNKTKRERRNDRFLAEQRAMFKAGTLSKERTERLQALGVDLSSQKGKNGSAAQAQAAAQLARERINTRIDELKNTIAAYDNKISIRLDPSFVARFDALKTRYNSLLRQYGGEALFPIRVLSEVLGMKEQDIEDGIHAGTIPPPVVELPASNTKGWSMLHLCGIELNMGQEMATSDPTRAWYGALLKEELAKARWS